MNGLEESDMTDAIDSLIRRVVEAEAPNTAVITASTTDEGIRVVEVRPISPTAAQMVANIDGEAGLVTLIFGAGAVFEIPKRGHRYIGRDLEGEVSALCSAVLLGDLEEDVWLKHQKVVRARARIMIADRTVTAAWSELAPLLFIGGKKETRRYTPYKA